MKQHEENGVSRSRKWQMATVTSRLPPPTQGTAAMKPFTSTTPGDFNFPFQPATTAAAPAAPADLLLKQIDERLKSLRAELAEHDPSLLLARPATAPAGGRRAPPATPSVPGNCMWPSFQTRQTRAAATAAAAAAKKSKDGSTSGNGV